jgi:hypothetical protein
MGQSLDQMLEQLHEGFLVDVAMVSNQDNGIASYAFGDLVFREAKGGVVGPTFSPARLESQQPFQMFFSDRHLDIDRPPEQGEFPHNPRQPFSANATEKLGMTITLQLGTKVMQLAVFGSKSQVKLDPVGDLLVGLGPSLGNSSNGVFTVAFLSFRKPL